MPQLFKKQNVEVFSVGEWNGDEYTLDDLHDMVKAFDETKAGVQPYLKLGHDPKQKLIQADGLPAAGWIDKLYVRGEKLIADFGDIPKKIFELIQNQAYKKVSCEIFWNTKFNGKEYRRMLSAVALLGADTPGVSNLSDILALYGVKSLPENLKIYNAFEFSDSEQNQKGGTMPEKEIQEKLESDLKLAQDELKVRDSEIATLKQFKIDAEAKALVLEQEAQAQKVKAFVSELKAEKLCSPAMEGLVTELLGETKKEYTVKLKDKEEKLSKEQVLKEALKLFKAAAEVNFDESSSAGDEGSKKTTDEEIDEKAKAFAAEHKVNYSKALKEILKTVKKGI
jgi:Mu-like prophage I protein